MWLIALLLLSLAQGVSNSNPCGGASPSKPTEPPFLVVKVVDPVWLPVPNAEVSVKAVNEKRQPKVAHTEENGDAEFWMQEDVNYTIEAKYPGFKTKQLKNVFLGSHSGPVETAYIEIQLQPAQTITVY